MKAYIITTGTVFGLIVLGHFCRLFVEGTHVATDPVFLIFTILAASLCFWACRLLMRGPRT